MWRKGKLVENEKLTCRNSKKEGIAYIHHRKLNSCYKYMLNMLLFWLLIGKKARHRNTLLLLDFYFCLIKGGYFKLRGYFLTIMWTNGLVPLCYYFITKKKKCQTV